VLGAHGWWFHLHHAKEVITMEVEFFDSDEALARRLQQAMKAADAKVRPWQAAILPGQCFITVAEDDLLVFGTVLEGYTEERLQHYRFCRCYSVACPEGELGDVHVSTVLRLISREQFEAAQARGWVPEEAGGKAPHPSHLQERTPALPYGGRYAVVPMRQSPQAIA
jgi:hypothetical protein